MLQRLTVLMAHLHTLLSQKHHNKEHNKSMQYEMSEEQALQDWTKNRVDGKDSLAHRCIVAEVAVLLGCHAVGLCHILLI